jgi:hypothetical protein
MSSPEEAAQRRARWWLGGLAAGAACAVVGLVWPQLLTPERVWSIEQAREYQQAFEAAHAATHGEVGEHAPDAELEQLRERYAQISGELAQARRVRGVWGRRLIQVGLVLAVCSGLGYLATRHHA